MTRDLFPHEREAIEDLKRLARRWPKSLMLFSNSGSLLVLDNDKEPPTHDKAFAHIPGIPNDGGDMEAR